MWDITLPPGSEAISNGDNRIRELKTDLQTALQTYGSFPGTDPANPKYIWTIARGNTASRPASPVTGQLYNNTQTFTLERYNGATWDDVNTLPAAAIVTETMLNTSVAGNGLAGGGGAALSVNVDNATIEINADTLRIKDLGVVTAKIAASAVDENKLNVSVAGNGLAGGGGAALSVNVDNSTIEINADTLRVKDGGITQAKLATAVVNQLGVDIGLVARATVSTNSTSNVDLVNITAHGRLRGMMMADSGNQRCTITIDGVSDGEFTAITPPCEVQNNVGNSTAMFQIAGSTTGTLSALLVFFRTSLRIQVRTTTAGPFNFYCAYERSA